MSKFIRLFALICAVYCRSMILHYVSLKIGALGEERSGCYQWTVCGIVPSWQYLEVREKGMPDLRFGIWIWFSGKGGEEGQAGWRALHVEALSKAKLPKRITAWCIWRPTRTWHDWNMGCLWRGEDSGREERWVTTLSYFFPARVYEILIIICHLCNQLVQASPSLNTKWGHISIYVQITMVKPHTYPKYVSVIWGILQMGFHMYCHKTTCSGSLWPDAGATLWWRGLLPPADLPGHWAWRWWETDTGPILSLWVPVCACSCPHPVFLLEWQSSWSIETSNLTPDTEGTYCIECSTTTHSSVRSDPYNKCLTPYHSQWFCFSDGTLLKQVSHPPLCYLGPGAALFCQNLCKDLLGK